MAVILGHYGTGKTTLLRKLLTGMRAEPERYGAAVIGSPVPSWTSFSLLEAIVSQFGLQPDDRSFVSYMEALHHYLMVNRNCITTLIIDDAQNLNKRGQLELLRLVQNLETPQHKLLNLILFAQLEWMPVLRAAPNFAQRINMTYTLGPLDVVETRRLIEFRLRRAGAGEVGPVFEDAAVDVIHAYAEGSPRVIVTLCRNALLLGAQIKSRSIGKGIILHTIQKTTLPDPEKNARVAAVLGATADEELPTLEDEQPRPDSPRRAARERVPQDRAKRLLLRAAQNTLAGPDDSQSRTR
jgi:general secretion pathway protein A